MGYLLPDKALSGLRADLLNIYGLHTKWNGLKNFYIVSKIDKKLVEKNTWQGKFYKNK
jgi:hypothetical protein